jgi:subtilisin family serine protease
VLASILLLAVGAAAAAQPMDVESGFRAKQGRSPVDPRLADLAGAAALRAAPSSDAWPMILSEDGVVIHAASNGDPHALLAELEAVGMREGAVSGNSISGLLPFGAIDALASCRHLAAARPAMATSHSELSRRSHHDRSPGSVTSQGVAAMKADRLTGSFDGRGARVGIAADSFDCRGGREQDTASGDLPRDIAILDDTNAASCSDEGRALAQVVHDVAPRSALAFHTGFNGQASFAEGIRELARDFGADVIVDDVLYFDEPFFQDGPIARAVDEVHEAGVVYVSAAGNASNRSYDAPFRHSGQTGFYQDLGETRRHDFDPGPGVDVFEKLTLPPSGVTTLVLQWAEPFVSASTANPPVGAASDYDLFVYRTESPRPGTFVDVYARSEIFNVGGDAFEALVLRNRDVTPVDVYLAIERFMLPGFDGPDIDRMKIIDFGTRIEREWGSGGGGTSFGHANARGAIAVGAAAWFQTPRFGVSPPLVQTFSSEGGVPILIDGAGQRLPAPIVRETPDLVAPDGVNTTFYAAPGDIPQDDDAFPNFFGTSAAAPHAAGVAALLHGRARGDVAPRKIERLLERSAVDMSARGYDLATGHGLIDARAAAERLSRLERDGDDEDRDEDRDEDERPKKRDR